MILENVYIEDVAGGRGSKTQYNAADGNLGWIERAFIGKLQSSCNLLFYCYGSNIARLIPHDRVLKPSAPTNVASCRNLCKRRWSVSSEDLLVRGFGDTMWEREFKVLSEELFDIRALDIIGLLDFDDSENLRQFALACSGYFRLK